MNQKRAWKKYLFFAVCVVLLFTFYGLLRFYGVIPDQALTPEQVKEKFGIERVVSPVDQNQNGIDDYMDFVIGARIDAENRPTYNGDYVVGGYPPDDQGVCTDLVWRAFKHAGYSLKDLVDADIAAHPEAYPATNGNPDPNIDFRRVRNLKVYFERNAVSLTLDPQKIEEWQPGDIVTFDHPGHIAIISDKRNRDGIPFILHNAGQPKREEDALLRYEISGHFRFDAQQMGLVPTKEETKN
jgi:uncharacterized protein YijF (DUF1287 family)